MRYLKVIEVPSLLTNHGNVRYVDAESRAINTSIKANGVIILFPEDILTALDSFKIEKEIKRSYKCFKSRFNNVPLKKSLSNCYLIFVYLMGGWGGRISLGKCDENLVR